MSRLPIDVANSHTKQEECRSPPGSIICGHTATSLALVSFRRKSTTSTERRLRLCSADPYRYRINVCRLSFFPEFLHHRIGRVNREGKSWSVGRCHSDPHSMTTNGRQRPNRLCCCNMHIDRSHAMQFLLLRLQPVLHRRSELSASRFGRIWISSYGGYWLLKARRD